MKRCHSIIYRYVAGNGALSFLYSDKDVLLFIITNLCKGFVPLSVKKASKFELCNTKWKSAVTSLII